MAMASRHKSKPSPPVDVDETLSEISAMDLYNSLNKSSSIIPTLSATKCVQCSVNLGPGDGIMLNSCLHDLCRTCIVRAVEKFIRFPVKCPLSLDKDCPGVLLDVEIEAMVGKSEYISYLEKSSLLNATQGLGDLVKCGNQECGSIFVLSDDERTQIFKCVQCRKITCLKCKKLRMDDVCECEKQASSVKNQNNVDVALKSNWDKTWAQLSNKQSTGSRNNFSSSNGAQSLLSQNLELIETFECMEEFDCSICFSSVPPGKGLFLQGCFHLYCKDCICQTVKFSTDPVVKCPFKLNDYTCNSYITEREIRALLSPDEYEKFLGRSVRQAEMITTRSFHCKTVNCTAWCELDDDERNDGETFKCPVCKQVNCLKCKAIHGNMTCAMYQAQLQENEVDVQTKKLLLEQISQGKAMKCPTCKIIIFEKIDGCDAILCGVCKAQICWATKLPRYGPKGKGDNSGGCGCDPPDNRCHPNCKGCSQFHT